LVNLAFYICMNKQIIITASLLGVLAVIAGAFGAHALKASLSARQLEVWQTAVQYQFYHVFALLFLSTFTRFKNKVIVSTYYLFTFGILLFSGSLYLLACRDLIGMPGLSCIRPYYTNWWFAVHHRMDIFSFRCFQKQIN
jgi:uncharacterized membrane protein YgdD (TMEM256/DUF423 family)